MTSNNEQQSPDQTSHYTEQLQKAQQNLKQFIPKYHRLVETERQLRQENRQLREEIETFNQRLITSEQELEQCRNRFSEFLALLNQIRREEQRSPALHPRPFIRKRLLQHQGGSFESKKHIRQTPAFSQELLPLNIWLVSQNRFMEQVISHYTRKRERLLVIENSELVHQLIKAGFFPDIIITGAYDFGLDDPFQQSFSEFLEQTFHDSHSPPSLRECFIITLSASIPVQSGHNFPFQQEHPKRHKFISKLHGLQVTISEMRFFLELRRCQQDVMEAEIHQSIHSMEDVTPVMTRLQNQGKTGMLVIFSDETPPDIRWAFQLFYHQGKLVKTLHTLESSALITADGRLEPLEKNFIFTSFDSQYQITPPEHLFFFPLYEHTVLREMKEEPIPFF